MKTSVAIAAACLVVLSLADQLRADSPLADAVERQDQAAIEEARKVEPDQFPSKKVRGNGSRLDINEAAFERIQKFRNIQAEALGIEGTMIATRNSMERMASTNLDEEERFEGVMAWQREVLEPVCSD